MTTRDSDGPRLRRTLREILQALAGAYLLYHPPTVLDRYTLLLLVGVLWGLIPAARLDDAAGRAKLSLKDVLRAWLEKDGAQ